VFFFFQAEDGIRYRNVTGVQTCALPISPVNPSLCIATVAKQLSPAPWLPITPCASEWKRLALIPPWLVFNAWLPKHKILLPVRKIGRASCRERVEVGVVGRACAWQHQAG